jgi:hypothetical protein
VSLRPLSFLLLLAHTRITHAIADFMLNIVITIAVASLAFLRWLLDHL